DGDGEPGADECGGDFWDATDKCSATGRGGHNAERAGAVAVSLQHAGGIYGHAVSRALLHQLGHRRNEVSRLAAGPADDECESDRHSGVCSANEWILREYSIDIGRNGIAKPERAALCQWRDGDKHGSAAGRLRV